MQNTRLAREFRPGQLTLHTSDKSDPYPRARTQLNATLFHVDLCFV